MTHKHEFTHFLDNHEYPRLLYRFPILVRFIYTLNYILTLRNWYVRRALRKLEHEQHPEFSFLDAGCGMGEFALGVAHRHPTAHIIGIDFTASNIPLANSVAREMSLNNAVFFVGDLTTLNVQAQYELILCNSTLQFIKQDVKALQNLHSVLKSNGVLLLYVPIRYRRYLTFSKLIEKKYLSDFYYKYHEDFLMHRYDDNDICAKVQHEGFTIHVKEYAYGASGAIAFELYSLILAALKRLPVVLSIPAILLYGVFIFPLQMILMIADFIISHSSGNGLLITLKKNNDTLPVSS